MSTLDELRQVFDEDALRAPDSHGLLATARTGAARIKRRRRVAAVAGAAALVAVVVAVLPLATRRSAAPPAATNHATSPATASAAPAGLTGGEIGVSVAAGSKFTAHTALDGTVQIMVLDTPRCCTEARVYDKGTYDSTALMKGETVTVDGHPAHYAVLTVRSPGSVPADPSSHLRLPTVGWQDATGAWVTVYHYDQEGQKRPADVKAKLIAAAAVVRVGPAKKIPLPFHLPAAPADLPITYADLTYLTVPGFDPYVEIGLGGDGKPVTEVTGAPIPSRPPAVDITAMTLAQAKKVHLPAGSPMLEVAGLPAWYYEGPRPVTAVAPLNDGQSMLLIKAARCYLQVTVDDHTAVTKADLVEMFAGATFDDCGDVSTWS